VILLCDHAKNEDNTIDNKKNVLDQVYKDLFNMLVTGQRRVAPGDRIPSENKLSQCFNVSRNINRTALNCMNVLGLSRPGRAAVPM
jgi:DNA-binding FadR family transcriptional regulator